MAGAVPWLYHLDHRLLMLLFWRQIADSAASEPQVPRQRPLASLGRHGSLLQRAAMGGPQLATTASSEGPTGLQAALHAQEELWSHAASLLTGRPRSLCKESLRSAAQTLVQASCACRLFRDALQEPLAALQHEHGEQLRRRRIKMRWCVSAVFVLAFVFSRAQRRDRPGSRSCRRRAG